MLVVFSPIFVADTKIISRHDFVAPLSANPTKWSNTLKQFVSGSSGFSGEKRWQTSKGTVKFKGGLSDHIETMVFPGNDLN